MWYPMSTECQWTHNTWKFSKTHFKVSTSVLSPWLNKCGPWQLWKSTWTRTSLAERKKWPFGFSGHQLNKSQLCLPGIIFLVPFIILFFLSFTFYYYISLSCRGRGGFPGSSVGKKSAGNAGKPWFNFWVKKLSSRRDRLPTPVFLGFPGGVDGKKFACNEGDLDWIPVLGKSNGGGHGNPLQYSCLENPMDRGVWQGIVHGVAKSWTQLSD